MMSGGSSETTNYQKLSAVISAGEQLSPDDIVVLVQRLCESLNALHGKGQLHAGISPNSVQWSKATGDVRLDEPAKATSFGGKHSNSEHCPPELSRSEEVRIPRDIEKARSVLSSAGVSVDPRRIDVYQTAALMCQLFTQSTIDQFRRSPKVKSRVPTELRNFMERALGYDKSAQIQTIDELANELRNSTEKAGEESQQHEQSRIPNGDTSPSVMGDQQPDTSPSVRASGSNLDDSAKSRTNRGDEIPFQTLGHFEIVSRIGHGGMGDVYKGYEKLLDRTVAIKVLPDDFARQDEFVQRFYSEATAAARLVHPNVVQIFFIGEDQGHHFFAMQYVPGSTLADHLEKRGRLSTKQTLAIITQVLSGLSAAHEFGLVHRDIKPANILIDQERGRAVLGDFGLVKMAETAAAKTATGIVMGTVDYIAPEQGRGHAVDHRSDLYSLGIVMYRMLSGQLPFEADSPTAMIFQHVYEKPKPLKEIVDTIPDSLVSVVARLMAKSPDDRYQSAQDVLSDLDAIRTGAALPSATNQPQSSAAEQISETAIIKAPNFDDGPSIDFPAEFDEPPPETWWTRLLAQFHGAFQEHAPDFVRRLQNTQQQVDGAVALYERRRKKLRSLAAEANGVLKELQAQLVEHRKAAAKTSDPAERQRSQQIADELASQIEDQREQIESMKLRKAKINASLEQVRSQRDILQARYKVAQAQLRSAGKSGPRQFNRKTLLAAGGIVALCALFFVIRGMLFTNSNDPLTTQIATADPQPVVEVKTPNDNRSEEITAESENEKPPLISVGRSRISSDLNNAPVGEVGQYVGHSDGVSMVAVSVEGMQILSGGRDNTLRLWNLNSGGELKLFEGHTDEVTAVAFSPDGKFGLSGSKDKTAKLWDLDTGLLVRTYELHEDTVTGVAFLPDEPQFFITAGADQRAIQWEMGSGMEVSTLGYPSGETPPSASAAGGLDKLNGHIEGLLAVAASSSQKVVTAGSDTVALTWNLQTQQVTSRLVGHQAPVSSVAISADGRKILSASFDQTVRLWNADTGESMKTLSGHTAPVNSVAISSDGKHGLSGSFDKTVRYWDLESGRELQRFSGHLDTVTSVAFTPDGRFAVSGGLDRTIRLWKLPVGGSVSPPSQPSTPTKRPTVDPIEPVAGLQRPAPPNPGPPAFINAAVTKFISPKPGGENFSSVRFSRDGRWLATGDAAGTVYVWDVPGKRLLHTLQTSEGKVTSVDFSPDGNRLVTGAILNSGSDASVVTIWELKSQTPFRRMLDVPPAVSAVAYSPDGKNVAIAGEGTWTNEGPTMVSVRKIDTGEEQLPGDPRTKPYMKFPTFAIKFGYGGEQVEFLQLFPANSPLGLAATSEWITGKYPDNVKRTRGNFKNWGPEIGAEAVAFSYEGHAIVGIHSREVLGQSFREIVSLNGGFWGVSEHFRFVFEPEDAGGVTALALSPDERYAVIATEDHHLRVFDLYYGRIVQLLPKTEKPATSIAFFKDGSRIATLHGNEVHIWAGQGQAAWRGNPLRPFDNLVAKEDKSVRDARVAARGVPWRIESAENLNENLADLTAEKSEEEPK